jgi:membrane protein DedA with SNARE-associated domain
MGELIHEILMFLTKLGGWGVMLGLMIEVIPSEIVLAYAGFLVQRGDLNFFEAVLFGTVGGVVAQIFVYWVGRYGGRPVLERYGKYILIRKHHIDVAENWFNKYGTGVIFTARFIPVVRHAISVPAGLARMPLSRFTLLTTLAVIPWSILFVWLGKSVGENWEHVDEKAAPYVMPFIWVSVGLTVLYVAYKVFMAKRSKKSGQGNGYVGEKHTAEKLQTLGSEYKVLNGRHVKARTGVQEIDHLIVGPNGIFHIETKNWEGRIRFTDKGAERGDGHQEDPTALLYRHEYVLKELLRGNKLNADVVGILCFSNPHCELNGSAPAFVTVKLDGLVQAIQSHKSKHALSSEEVRTIVKLLQDHSTPSQSA